MGWPWATGASTVGSRGTPIAYPEFGDENACECTIRVASPPRRCHVGMSYCSSRPTHHDDWRKHAVDRPCRYSRAGAILYAVLVTIHRHGHHRAVAGGQGRRRQPQLGQQLRWNSDQRYAVGGGTRRRYRGLTWRRLQRKLMVHARPQRFVKVHAVVRPRRPSTYWHVQRTADVCSR